MPFTHQLDLAWHRGNDQFPMRIQVEANVERNLDMLIEPGTVDLSIPLLIEKDKLALIVLVALAGDLVVKTNQAETPGQTLTLHAGEPLLWWTDCHHENPLTNDITELFVSNAGDNPILLKLRCLESLT